MADKIRVAFVGCTHPHIFPRVQLLSNEPDVTLVGCYDPDANVTAGIERRCGIKAYDSAEQLLDEPGVNFAIIEGWDTHNPAYVRQAVQRGQAVMVEKPGAPNLLEMQKLVDDIRGKDVPFQVGYMLRFSPVVTHMQRILADGVLGEITLARFHAAAPAGGAAEVWQSVPGNMGGAVFTDGCHMVDIIVHLLGMPAAAKGMTLKLPEGKMVLAHGFKKDALSELDVTVTIPIGNLMYEDAGVALLEYRDKLVVFDVTGWEAHPWVEAWRIELYGTDGVLHAGLNPPWYRLYVRNLHEKYQPGWQSWEDLGNFGVGNSLVVDSNYTNEIQHMLKRVHQWDTDNAVWMAEAEGVIAILEAIFKSASRGDAVPVESRF